MTPNQETDVGEVTLRITDHAVMRYRERVADVSDQEARAAILGAITHARTIEFHAMYVKLGTGQRIVIEGNAVITVLARETSLNALSLKAHGKRVLAKLGMLPA